MFARSVFFNAVVKIFKYGVPLTALAIAGSYIYGLVAASDNTRAALLSLLVSVIIAAWTANNLKQREIEATHRQQKLEGYTKYIEPFIYLGGKHTKKKMKDSQFEEHIQDFKKTLMLSGNADTIKMWNQAAQILNSEANTDEDKIAIAAELLKLLRKDLGHKDAELESSDIIKIIIHAENHQEIEKAIQASKFGKNAIQ